MSQYLNSLSLVKKKLNEKHLNISKTLDELSLKEDDVLFIDDNQLERRKVKSKFPKISLLEFDDLENYLSKLMQHPRLQKFHIIKEDKKKYHQYKLKNKYHDLKAKSKGLDKVYFELKQKINWEKLTGANINRAEQLFNKTNQFNFSTNRFNKEQLKKINNTKNHFIRMFSLKDKFGDHGIIGSIIYSKINKIIYISDFLISCRVLSRKIEEYVLYHILKQNNVKKGYIIFKKTDKNFELISKFLENDFFSKTLLKKKGNKNSSKSNVVYEINCNKKLNEVKKFFRR